MITGHHTTDIYEACNVTSFATASPAITNYDTCTTAGSLIGGRIPAKIGVYFSGSSDVSSIHITVNPVGGPASDQCSGNINRQTFAIQTRRCGAL
jgi:hypothetical protein